MKIICDNCGTPNNKGATYCSFCYKKLEKGKKGKKKDADEAPKKITYSQPSSQSSGFSEDDDNTSGFGSSSGGSLADRIAASKKDKENQQKKQDPSLSASPSFETDSFDLQTSGFSGFEEPEKTEEVPSENGFVVSSGFETSRSGFDTPESEPKNQETGNEVPEIVPEPVVSKTEPVPETAPSQSFGFFSENTENETETVVSEMPQNPGVPEEKIIADNQPEYTDTESGFAGFESTDKNTDNEIKHDIPIQQKEDIPEVSVQQNNDDSETVVPDSTKSESPENKSEPEPEPNYLKEEKRATESSSNTEKDPNPETVDPPKTEPKIIAKKVVIGKQKKKTPSNNRENSDRKDNAKKQTEERKPADPQKNQQSNKKEREFTEEDLFLRPSKQQNKADKQEPVDQNDIDIKKTEKESESTLESKPVTSEPLINAKTDDLPDSVRHETENVFEPPVTEITAESKQKEKLSDQETVTSAADGQQEEIKNEISDHQEPFKDFVPQAVKKTDDSISSVQVTTETDDKTDTSASAQNNENGSLSSGLEQTLFGGDSDDGFLTDQGDNNHDSDHNSTESETDREEHIPSLAERIQKEQDKHKQESDPAPEIDEIHTDRSQRDEKQDLNKTKTDKTAQNQGFIAEPQTKEPKQEESLPSVEPELKPEKQQVKKEGFFTFKPADRKPAKNPVKTKPTQQNAESNKTNPNTTGFITSPQKQQTKIGSPTVFSGIKPVSAEKERLQPYGPSIRVMDEIVYHIVSTKEGIVVTNNPTTNNAFRAFDGTIIEKQPNSESGKKNNLLKTLPYDGYYDDVIPADFENEETMKFDRFDKETVKKIGVIVGLALAAFIIAAIVFIYF